MTALALAQPAAADACGPVETMPDEGHHHLVEGHEPPIPYGSTPPTSGWHYRAQGESLLGRHGQDEPLSEPQQVSVLAAGGVVVTYRDLDPDDVDTLVAYIKAEERPVALTPYEKLEAGQLGLTAWTVRQLCDGLDVDAVAAFDEAHAAEALDLTMGANGDSHEHGDADEPGAGAASPPTGNEPSGATIVVVAASALGGLAVAGLSMYTATTARLREYAVLKAIGMRNPTLYALVSRQSLLTVIVGLLVAIALAALIAFWLFVRFTRIGLALRTVAQDREIAEAQGIDTRATYRVTFFLATMLAGLGGVFRRYGRR